ncbi:PEP-CTERM sorting domain-containing protein [Microcoleus sp. B4-C5]
MLHTYGFSRRPTYEYEPVPEPMTAVGTFVAAGMGLWWKRRAAKKV